MCDNLPKKFDIDSEIFDRDVVNIVRHTRGVKKINEENRTGNIVV
jgi:hypothetical protein